MLGLARHLVERHPPPPGPDDLVDREPAPHVADAQDGVQPGVRDEDHVGVRAGRDGGQRPAGPGREQVGHLPGPLGQVAAAGVLQPPDAAAPAAGRPVGALGEDHQRAGRVQAAGQPLDLLGEDALPGLAVPDEHVGQPVAQHVQAGVELQRRLHHHPRPAPVDAEQLVDEQERVAGPGVPGQHDDRAGQPGGQFVASELRLVDLGPQAVGPFGPAVQRVQEPADDRVVAALVGLGVQPAAEPAHDPQPEQHDQRHDLGGQPDHQERHQPQVAHPARPQQPGQPGQQREHEQQRRQHDQAEGEGDHHRGQHEPADQPGWEHQMPSRRTKARLTARLRAERYAADAA